MYHFLLPFASERGRVEHAGVAERPAVFLNQGQSDKVGKVGERVLVGKPVEVEDKHALKEAQEKLHSIELLQEYAKVQADFQDLMNRVTKAIHEQIHLEPVWDDEDE